MLTCYENKIHAFSYMADLNERIRWQTSFIIDQFSPVPWAKNVMIPNFLYQMRDDLYTQPSAAQAMYHSIPVADKKLFWIEGSTHRWDGYASFQQQPHQVITPISGDFRPTLFTIKKPRQKNLDAAFHVTDSFGTLTGRKEAVFLMR